MESKSHRVGGPTIGQVAQMPRAQLGTIEILAVVQVKIRFKQKKIEAEAEAEETRVGWILYLPVYNNWILIGHHVCKKSFKSRTVLVNWFPRLPLDR